MTTTVQELLQTKYDKFIEDIKPIIPEFHNLLDRKDEADLLEILELLIFLFPDNNYMFHLNEVLKLKQVDITDEQKNNLIPFIEQYLEFLRKIKSHLNI